MKSKGKITIYCLKNNKNNKCYVGRTNNLKKRILQHKYMSNNGLYKKRYGRNNKLYNAMEKFGFDCFQIKILEMCKKSIARDKEWYWIAKLRASVNGYNCTNIYVYSPYLERELRQLKPRRKGEKK